MQYLIFIYFISSYNTLRALTTDVFFGCEGILEWHSGPNIMPFWIPIVLFT